ncbi:MAG TPA: RNA polymerase sigma factor [Firmicutes bacterium]|nr:RNA polymerase sigma factor [Bacillota bacterium]
MDQRQTACDRIVACYADMLFRIAVHYLKVREDAEDVVHDVLLRWLEKAPAFRDAEHEKAWFIRVAVNLCKDRRKSAFFTRRADWDHCAEPAAEPASPLLQEVLSLPPQYSTVLYLYYYEGYSIREIAQMTGKGERAVQSQLHRARRKLKSEMEEDDCGHGKVS